MVSLVIVYSYLLALFTIHFVGFYSLRCDFITTYIVFCTLHPTYVWYILLKTIHFCLMTKLTICAVFDLLILSLLLNFMFIIFVSLKCKGAVVNRICINDSTIAL